MFFLDIVCRRIQRCVSYNFENFLRELNFVAFMKCWNFQPNPYSVASLVSWFPNWVGVGWQWNWVRYIVSGNIFGSNFYCSVGTWVDQADKVLNLINVLTRVVFMQVFEQYWFEGSNKALRKTRLLLTMSTVHRNVFLKAKFCKFPYELLSFVDPNFFGCLFSRHFFQCCSCLFSWLVVDGFTA